MRKTTSSPTPFIDSANEAYQEMLYKDQYELAEALKERVYVDTGVTLQCESCGGRGQVEGVTGVFPCYCQPEVEALTDNYYSRAKKRIPFV